VSNLKESVIKALKDNGADLIGFGSVDRFKDTVIPSLMPEAKTVICAAFRVLRGSHRGIEDGTTYYQYTTMAVETIEENVMPIALLRACAVLEDAGFSALPQRRHQTVMADIASTNPEIDYEEVMRGRKTEVELDFDKTAVLCGLGEIGDHHGLLTKPFGPFQRLCAIITDAEIEPDEIAAPMLCDHCGECKAACPGQAIEDNGLNVWQCSAYYMGANMSKNPFLPPEAFAGDPDREAIVTGKAKLSSEEAKSVIDRLIYYPPVKHGYTASICGKACHRACYVHLEKTGKLAKAFRTPLRPGEEWKLPILPEKN